MNIQNNVYYALTLNLDKDTTTKEKHKSLIKDIKSYGQVSQCVTEYKKLKQHLKISQRPSYDL
jgi:hypothetical protein